jgi:hypothetical protein
VLKITNRRARVRTGSQRTLAEAAMGSIKAWQPSRRWRGKCRGIAMIRGCCLCGGIRFEIDAARSLTHCHCKNCRKLSGAAFASYLHVDTDKFRFISGEELIQRFESAPGSFRNFCRVCSSTVPGKAAYLTTVSIPAGLLDGDPGVRPRLHVFVGSRAPWWEITDDLPQHDKWVPGHSPQEQT